jgi:hypothetical protein
MSTIEVVRHGERWAVCEDGGTPIEEYDTRELAEVAARGLADERGGAEIVVDDSGDEQLGRGGVAPTGTGESSGPDARERAETPDAAETMREPQAGL